LSQVVLFHHFEERWIEKQSAWICARDFDEKLLACRYLE